MSLNNPKWFIKQIYAFLSQKDPTITKKEVREASKAAYHNYELQKEDNKRMGRLAIEKAREMGVGIIVLAGRPYHIDPEINHGVNSLITSLGWAVVSEDCVADLVKGQRVKSVDLSFPLVQRCPLCNAEQGYGAGTAGILWMWH